MTKRCDMFSERLERLAVQLFVVLVLVGSYGVALVEPFWSSHKVPYLPDGVSARTLPFYPFSSYPMFSDLYEPEFIHQLRLYEVTEDDRESALFIDTTFPPFWEAGLRESLQNQARAGKEPEVCVRALFHSRPIESTIRVSLVSWRWSDWVYIRSNVPKAEPEHAGREVLMEVRPPNR